jgi:23S rRNA pseudouridine1911/1915/1917 synthase
MAPTIKLVVPADLAGERVDKTLAMLLGVSRAVARELLDLGVTVGGQPAKPDTRVRVGDVIATPAAPVPEELAAEDVDFEVIYEDDQVVVVNKPPGLVVHPGAAQRTGTLAAGLLHRYPEVRGVGESGRWGLVHRLDKDTSGALLVARDQDSFLSLTAALRAREIKREYLTLVAGTMAPPTGTIDAAIGRDPNSPTKRSVTPEGKHARTHYRVVRNYPESGAALVDVSLETGRTHQIRVHFLAIGHPVIGDRTYNSSPTGIDSPRVFLHAGRLTFVQPATDITTVVEAPLPQDLASVLDSLESASGD